MITNTNAPTSAPTCATLALTDHETYLRLCTTFLLPVTLLVLMAFGKECNDRAQTTMSKRIFNLFYASLMLMAYAKGLDLIIKPNEQKYSDFLFAFSSSSAALVYWMPARPQIANQQQNRVTNGTVELAQAPTNPGMLPSRSAQPRVEV